VPIDRARGERGWAEPSCLPDGRVLVEVETDNSNSLHVFADGPMVGDDPNSHRDLFVARVDSRNGVEVGPPVRLFDAAALGLDITARGARAYDVAPDGQRLIVATNGIEGTPTITLVDDLDALIRSRR